MVLKADSTFAVVPVKPISMPSRATLVTARPSALSCDLTAAIVELEGPNLAANWPAFRYWWYWLEWSFVTDAMKLFSDCSSRGLSTT